MTLLDFAKAKGQRKLSLITCYDYWSAKIINNSPIDAILVGDSASMVMHGSKSTLEIDVQTLAMHTKAVRRGASEKLIIADLPFLSYRKSLDSNMNAVEELMKSGANGVKLEGALGNLKFISHLVASGVPVMGHLGLTPQFVNPLGGYRVQAKDKTSQKQLIRQAVELEEAGCFSIVLECIPSNIAGVISKKLNIPIIGIGAGIQTDGQILVLQDMLGLNSDINPKFVRKYLKGEELLLKALNEYCSDICSEKFPTLEESYL